MQTSENQEKESTPTSVKAAFGLAVLGAAVSVQQWTSGEEVTAVFIGISALVGLFTGFVLQKKPLTAGLATSLVGVGVAAYLTFFPKSASSACSQGSDGSAMDCGAVWDNQWAHIFGLDTSLIACAFYAGLSACLFYGIKKEKKQEAAVLLLLAGVGSSLFSGFLAYQSKVIVGKWCIFCISLYAVAALCLAAGILSAMQHPKNTMKGALLGAGSALWIRGAAVALIIVAIGMGAPHKHGENTTSRDITEDYNLNDTESQNVPPLERLQALYKVVETGPRLSGHEPAKGSVRADWTLVEFTDYSCGHCATAGPGIQALVDSYPRLKLLHKHYAFIRPSSIIAAHAAECAHRQNRFWEMNNALFKDQEVRDWNESQLRFIAEKMLGLDADKFQDCLKDPKTKASVDADYASGEAAGVNSTPSLFLTFDAGTTWLKMTDGTQGANILLWSATKGAKLPGLSTSEKAGQ